MLNDTEAFNHLLKMARGTSRGENIARDFLLWWWNEEIFGVFDFHRLVHVEGKTFKAIVDLSRAIFRGPTTYPSEDGEFYSSLRELALWELERRNRQQS